MRSADLLRYAFDQVDETLRSALHGLEPDDLAHRPGPGANTVAWLAWHLLRVQDDHVAEVAGRPQVWTDEGWADRFALPFDTAATGYGFDAEQVAAVRVPATDLLLGYAAAVHARTAEFLADLTDDDLDRVVDERYDPPVTLGVRLVSVLSDDLQHVGQAAYARGLLGGP
ncbi:mycothiol transferase [Blastococcus sp. SYSU D01042]